MVLYVLFASNKFDQQNELEKNKNTFDKICEAKQKFNSVICNGFAFSFCKTTNVINKNELEKKSTCCLI